MKSHKHQLLFLLLAFAVSLLALRVRGAGTTPANATWTQSRASQLVFFAVLEGLYRDGISNEDVDLIIPPGDTGKPKFDKDHFVYTCPLCHPAFEAFRLYRQREDFFGFKRPQNSFGSGLDAHLAAGLRNSDASQRRQVIQGLIGRWVSQRLDMMRLSAAERETITREMEEGRNQGMNSLEQASQTSQTRTNCPICDGSFGACKLQPRSISR